MRIGIDLGGTKIEIIALDSNGEVFLRKRIPTPKNDYEQICKSITSLVNETREQLSQKTTIGIGIPGSISNKSGLVKNANTTCLIGKPFKEDLEKLLNTPIKMENDANCFTISESIDGAASKFQNVFGVILGTGVGGGLVVDKKTINGLNSIAGEWGHNPLPWSDDVSSKAFKCYCGKYNCIETFISGTGFENNYFMKYSQKLNAKKIVELANSGDRDAISEIEILEERIAKSFSMVINIFDPDVIVIGGGLSNVDRFYKNIPKLISDYTFSDEVRTQIVKAKFGDSSGVRGAAWLWN